MVDIKAISKIYEMNELLMELYQKLLNHFGEKTVSPWWPMDHNFQPAEWEVCVGAILTQNTNWNNVKKTLDNLAGAGCISPESTINMNQEELEELIKPSGFYKQKSKSLKQLALEFNSRDNFLENIQREDLLKINGIGPETADSILLYACNKSQFPMSKYVRQVYSRLGLISREANYEEAKNFFESYLSEDVKIYQQLYGLTVKLAQNFCKKKPVCEKCPLKDYKHSTSFERER